MFDEFDIEIAKANLHLRLKNEPGKTSPRWYAATRNLEKAYELTESDDTKQDIALKMTDALEYSNRR